jgi:hypothetical protein
MERGGGGGEREAPLMHPRASLSAAPLSCWRARLVGSIAASANALEGSRLTNCPPISPFFRKKKDAFAADEEEKETLTKKTQTKKNQTKTKATNSRARLFPAHYQRARTTRAAAPTASTPSRSAAPPSPPPARPTAAPGSTASCPQSRTSPSTASTFL